MPRMYPLYVYGFMGHDRASRRNYILSPDYELQCVTLPSEESENRDVYLVYPIPEDYKFLVNVQAINNIMWVYNAMPPLHRRFDKFNTDLSIPKDSKFYDIVLYYVGDPKIAEKIGVPDAYNLGEKFETERFDPEIPIKKENYPVGWTEEDEDKDVRYVSESASVVLDAICTKYPGYYRFYN